jgi:hypothetical protein
VFSKTFEIVLAALPVFAGVAADAHDRASGRKHESASMFMRLPKPHEFAAQVLLAGRIMSLIPLVSKILAKVTQMYSYVVPILSMRWSERSHVLVNTPIYPE